MRNFLLPLIMTGFALAGCCPADAQRPDQGSDPNTITPQQVLPGNQTIEVEIEFGYQGH